MILTREISLEDKIPKTVLDGLTVTSFVKDGQEFADLLVDVPCQQFRSSSFLSLTFDFDKKIFVPFLSIVNWNNLILLMGAMSWITVLMPHKKFAPFVELNRRKDDDRGFYDVYFCCENGFLIAIYEGGVIGFSEKGEILWHHKKTWDEIFVRLESGKLYFDSEFSGKFAIEIATGKLVPLV